MGASQAIFCINESNHHVVNVTKESDSVVGSMPSRKAREKRVVYSLAEGDQPSLLIGLLTWVKAAGLTPVSVGKASEYDFIYDRDADTVTVLGDTLKASGISRTLDPAGDPASAAAERARICSRFSQKNVPDFTEMQIVCNHVENLHPDTPVLHTPIATTLEIPTLLCPKSMGGILSDTMRIDVVNSLRRSDEMSLEGGVFVVAFVMMRKHGSSERKGVAVSRNDKTALIYYPAHYLGFETLFTIFDSLPWTADRF